MPQYEIRLGGRLDPSWSAWFDGLVVSATGSDETILRGLVVDQTALHSVLARIRDLRLELLSLRRLEG